MVKSIVERSSVEHWMRRLKKAWEGKDVEAALSLFRNTQRYYERPFRAGTTQAEFRKYWEDIVSLSDIELHFDVIAVDGSVACVHWVNKFLSTDGKRVHLDGMFAITFDERLDCVEFRQWWFMDS